MAPEADAFLLGRFGGTLRFTKSNAAHYLNTAKNRHVYELTRQGLHIIGALQKEFIVMNFGYQK